MLSFPEFDSVFIARKLGVLGHMQPGATLSVMIVSVFITTV